MNFVESTLFGVCVIQIKPQLEKLLKLPDDSLTKEIKLSQVCTNLFVVGCWCLFLNACINDYLGFAQSLY